MGSAFRSYLKSLKKDLQPKVKGDYARMIQTIVASALILFIIGIPVLNCIIWIINKCQGMA